MQSQPHVDHVLRWVQNGTRLRVVCQTAHGDLVRDPGVTQEPPFTTWDQLDDGTWVYDWYPGIGMTVGHVGVVKAVHGDGSIAIEQYNLRENGMYSILHMARNSSAVDRSNGRGPWAVPWPDHFIHIHGR